MTAAIYARKSHGTGRSGRRSKVSHPADRARAGLRRWQGLDGTRRARLRRRRHQRRRVREPSRLPAADECAEAAAAVSGARDVRGIAARTRSDRDGLRAQATRDRPASGCSSTSRTASGRSTPPPTRSCCRSRHSPTNSSARRRGSGRMTRCSGRPGPATSPAAASSATTTSRIGYRRGADAVHQRGRGRRRARHLRALCAGRRGFARSRSALNATGCPVAAGAARTTHRLVVRRPCAKCSIGRSIAARSSGTRRGSATRGGSSRPQHRPESDWMRVPAPELRIVVDEAWTPPLTSGSQPHAQPTCAATKGELWGKPANGLESKHLLTGLRSVRSAGVGCTSPVVSTGQRPRVLLRLHHLSPERPDGLPQQSPDHDGRGRLGRHGSASG